MKAERTRQTWRTMMLVTLSVALFPLAAHAQYSGGRGTPDDPYQIATAIDFITLGRITQDYDKHFILTADIDLDPNLFGRQVFLAAVIAHHDEEFSGTPYRGIPFSGVFDGNGHTISHFHARGGDYVGLFGQLAPEGHLCNLGVEDMEIIVGGDGILTGGLVAWNNGGTISNCYATGTIESGYYVGGLVGANEFGTIRNCHSNASVAGAADVGGLVGLNYCGTTAECQSAGNVSGDGPSFGGLIGENHVGTVWSCFSTGNVTVEGDCVGGLVGFNNVDGLLVDCHSNSSVVGFRHVGGLVGRNGGGVVSMCSSQGYVCGNETVGGLVGYNSTYTDYYGRNRWYFWLYSCYSTASVVGNEAVGGLVGANYGSIINSYSCGSVSGQSEVGGLTGSSASYSNMTFAFWDVQSSGQATSNGGTGLTTTQMQDPNTYRTAGWDLADSWQDGTTDVWQIPAGGGYPTLAALNGYIPPQLQGQGTPDEPYLLHDAKELGSICHREPWAHYRLANSIDLSAIRWGTSVVSLFTGAIDGNDLSISGLTIVGTMYVGLIGSLEEGEVRDLRLIDVNIVGSTAYIGGVAGWSNGDISGCSISGAISGQNCIGGFAGMNRSDGTILNCHNGSSISGISSTGGVVGSNAGLISRCDNTGSIDGVSGIGGVIGASGSTGIIWSCQNNGSVHGDDDVGGVAGRTNGTALDCHNAASVTGINNVGGVAGSMDGIMSMSSNSGSVVAAGLSVEGKVASLVEDRGRGSVEVTGLSVGGLIGATATEYDPGGHGSIFCCFNCGSVNGYYAVGGLIGSGNFATMISDCYNRGEVVAISSAGGVAGDFQSGDMMNCYSTGRVTTDGSRAGGLTGHGWLSGPDTNFWDTIASGQTSNYGGTGLATAEMQRAQTFLDAGWDFIGETANGSEDIWWIDEGRDYPRLWWEAAGE